MRRTGVAFLACAAAVAATLSAPNVGGAATDHIAGRTRSCPAAENLVGGWTNWRHHYLAPGVQLLETTAHDRRGRVNIHVLRVDLGARGVKVAPLYKAIAGRHPLTELAARRHLVAATNGMYFSFGYGAPVVPFINHGQPLVLSTRMEHVAGIGQDNRPHDADVWLDGALFTKSGERPLVAINEVNPPRGLALYTSQWGRHPVPMSHGARSLVLRNGHVVTRASRHGTAPAHGFLLVANGAGAVHWLRKLWRGQPISGYAQVETNGEVSFRQAYGVGTELVGTTGELRRGLYCHPDEVLSAHTSIGWIGDGRVLLLVTVDGNRGKRQHGLDENQMSEILVELGASRAFALDGGGSTEMAVRWPGRRRVSIRSLLTTGHQRYIPVGVGVFSTR